MSEFTKDEALAFIDAMRMTLEGKVGFKWLVERLDGLKAYLDGVATENALLNAYVDETGSRAAFEAFREAHGQTPE